MPVTINGSTGITTADGSVFTNASGNVGIGVTPSAWTRPAIQGGAAGTVFYYGATNVNVLSANTFFDGSNKYIGNGFATQYSQSSGVHAWDIASSGTAGNAITFTRAMVLDASGNLGIGTSDPATWGKLAVSGAGTTTPTNFENLRASSVVINDTNGGTAGSTSGFFVARGTASGSAGLAGGYGVVRENASHWGTALTFYTHPADTTDIKQLVERARIDSSGNLLVGVSSFTANTTKFVASTADLSSAITAQNTNASNNNDVLLVRASRNSTGGSYSAISYYNDGAGAYRFKVFDSGNVQNTNNSYGALSDAKLKENVTDATPKLEKLNRVRVVNFNLIGEQQKQIGVIAQELEQIFPGMVEESPDRDAEGNDLGTTTKAVKYSVFTPMLIKAVQELTAKLDAAEARIAALEAK